MAVTKELLCDSLSDALEARRNAAPHFKLWLLKMADALEVDTRTARDWVGGNRAPEAHQLINLFDYMGNGFRDEVLKACGLDVDAPPDDAYMLRKLADKLENGKS